jgi:uncharacterized heparinase superfamily protein
MKKFLLVLNTVRYLKWQQIYFRVVRRLVKPVISDEFKNFDLVRPKNWQHVLLYNQKIETGLSANFLNHKKNLDFPIDWNTEIPSKLWVYNLHYFEDLLSDNAHDRAQLHRELLDIWVDQNSIGSENSWDPYPTSLRIVNVLKAWLGGLELNHKVLGSLFYQASYLSNDLEKHLLGNHYFVNLKALLFAGVIYDITSWRKTAEHGLLSEIPEQILNDGANFELSPMYHSLMLTDMLDIANLIRAFPLQVSRSLALLVENTVPKMLKFMEVMSHPDGGVSFFNDSVDGVAPAKFRIEMYAKKLDYVIEHIELDKTLVFDNEDSGYICVVFPRSKLIFDASPVGPDYIPGHAHADTLSFELSIGFQRVLVNLGVSEYGLSSSRTRQRKTLSHNTVEIDGKDSSQVWSGFRVAKRARILSRDCKLDSDQKVVLNASHDGYKTLLGGCFHNRQIVMGDDTLVVTDTLIGTFRDAVSRFHFHPDLTVSIDDNFLKVEGKEFIVTSDLTGKVASIYDSEWHPEFGVSKYTSTLKIHFVTDQLEIIFKWRRR